MLKAIPVLFFLLLFPISAFAEEEVQVEVKGTIDDFFDSIGDMAEASINTTTFFDQDKKEQVNEVTESAVATGKTAFDLWFSFHQLIVDAIFAGSPIPFDRGIIVLVSFVVGTVLVFLLFWNFIKRIWKIALVIVAIIAIVLIAPIEFPSLA